ncbi:DNL zinc finger-domain-containing protein [Mycena albidolilacea]|uniref:DNL zinc finger-domain-containing protein n=1 Tax=Mycena albidolilacea TaxID=1033008 RepID=A0AAD6Z0L4_9AGAR|nr:DNL zinc finger-domain-containing protein [Mycena albidolilacea]
MLPSRLFRNLGIPPALRSLITPHSSLPPTISVQLRLRLGAQPGSLVSAQRLASYSTAAPGVPGPSQDASSEPTTTSSQALPESIVPKLSMTFTCTADNCGERSTHEFSRQAYESGIVLVQCPGCHNRHLIADHIGWFKESTEEGKLRTVEDLLRARGEKVTRGTLGSDGVVEYAPE